jgi:hypothetical protein
MATTAIPNRPRTGPRARTSGPARVAADNRDAQYDLLTATLIGVAIGVGTTLLLRTGPSGSRPIAPMVRGAGRTAAWAGRGAAHAGSRGARWVRQRGGKLWDQIPRDEIEENVRDYLSQARSAIDDTVASELQNLRKAIRRQRKRLGI